MYILSIYIYTYTHIYIHIYIYIYTYIYTYIYIIHPTNETLVESILIFGSFPGHFEKILRRLHWHTDRYAEQVAWIVGRWVSDYLKRHCILNRFKHRLPSVDRSRSSYLDFCAVSWRFRSGLPSSNNRRRQWPQFTAHWDRVMSQTWGSARIRLAALAALVFSASS